MSSIPRPLLTIAIPTYNRSGCLLELLTYLVPQLKDQPEVELVISDNASTDSTPSIIKRFERAVPAFVHLHNETNLGMDGNFLQCFERARGKYLWLIGDDDVLAPGSLGKLLPLLSGPDLDLVYITSHSFQGAYAPPDSVSDLQPDIVTSGLAFVQRVHIALTFLSGNIVNRERALSLDHPPFSSLDGTKLVQLGWTYTLLRHFRQGLIINEPLIAARADNTGGYAVFTVFGVTLRRITEQWLGEPAMVSSMLRGTIRCFLPWLLLKVKYQNNTFDAEDARTVLREAYGDLRQYWLLTYPIIRLPRRLARVWFFFVRLLLTLDRWTGSSIFG